MQSPTSSSSSSSTRSDEQSLDERWRAVKTKLQQQIQRLRQEILEEEHKGIDYALLKDDDDIKETESPISDRKDKEQPSVDDMYKDYIYEEHAEFRRLQWRLQKARVENLGLELASLIQGRREPDFLSPWYATTTSTFYDLGSATTSTRRSRSFGCFKTKID